jgi:hypothetical protein
MTKDSVQSKMDSHRLTGERVVAEAKVRPPGAIEAQKAGSALVVLTDTRLLVYRCGLMLGTNTGELAAAYGLDDIAAMETHRRHPIMTVGVPIFLVAIVLESDQQLLRFETSGIGIGRLRRLAEHIAELRPELPTVSAYAASRQVAAESHEVAQHWAPDPTGRHQSRWWDGTAWTSHVCDGADTTTDPL